MADWDWQVFCRDTVSSELVPHCFGEGGDITYLQWMLSAWGWTLAVSLFALLIGADGRVPGGHSAHYAEPAAGVTGQRLD